MLSVDGDRVVGVPLLSADFESAALPFACFLLPGIVGRDRSRRARGMKGASEFG